MKKYTLNTSQKGIWQNQFAAPNSAINIISVKLYIDGFSAESVKDAADKVILSADVFRSALHQENDEIFFVLSEEPFSFCKIKGSMTEEEAEAYTKTGDLKRLNDGELYRAEVIPTKDTGVLLYVRFDHMIIDGFGMSLFAQRVLDVLEGKNIVTSEFFCTPDISEEKEGKEVEQEQKRFWSSYFDDGELQPEIFSEDAKTTEKTVKNYDFPQELSQKIKAFAEKESITEAYFYAAAYAVYLAKATGKQDAVILMPRLNRKLKDMNTLGCYTLLIPVRVNFRGCKSFIDLAKRLMFSAQEASKRKAFGFSNIRKEVQEESLSAYVFNYYRYEIKTEIQYTLDISVAGAMENHLTFTIFRFDRNTVFSFDLRREIYDEERADFFYHSIETILLQAMEGIPVEEMKIIGALEEEKLSNIKGKVLPLEASDTIVSIFEKAAEKYGDLTALYAGKDSLTYKALDEVTDTVAANLILRGVKKGEPVAFLLQRDIRMIPVIIGILKCGGAFVPIDAKYPKDRVMDILKDSGARFLISAEEVENKPENWLDVNLLFAPACPVEKPQLTRNDLAYIIYTSGTTGKPKGVMLAHRGIVNITMADNNPFNREITADGSKARGIVAVGSIGFDISVFEIFVPLINGIFVELAPEEALTDPKALAKLIDAHGADIMHCTPSRLASYLKLDSFAKSFRKIKAVLSAGEVLSGSFVEQLKAEYGVKIFNGYGPTETTIGATITEAGDNRTIGKPIANTGILILGKDNTVLPYGAAGEICIYGEGMGLGYKNLPKITEEKFCDFRSIKIYKTGDIGHLDREGRLIYHGRNDRLVKLRGLRIELPEVEGAMTSFKDIDGAVCLVRKVGKSEHLAGFYTTHENKAIDESELKKDIGKKLPIYMVPDIFIHLFDMPQTTSGKTDMKALAVYPLEMETKYIAPKNDAEKFICEKIDKLLKCGDVSAGDSFFDLGGDSLSAVMLSIELEEMFGEGGVCVADVYQCPTAILLAEKLTGTQKKKTTNPLEKLNYRGFDELLQCPKCQKESFTTKNLGNVLLTGATGYLGSHILMELLKREELSGKIFCLARGKGKLSAEKRVKGTLFYYGEDDFSDSYGEKWEVVEGDITDEKLFADGENFCEGIDTVINSAANVAHFSHDDRLNAINTKGVEHLIKFCLKEDAKLCQISTISVGGAFDAREPEKKLTEKDFFMGQTISNQYILSKFMAEYHLLRAKADDGLKIKIMRVGNLQGRIRDGEFQMNMKTNAFTRQISSYARMGAVPKALYESSVNFSPVDEVAHMIVTLAAGEGRGDIFHVYPKEEVPYRKIFETLRKLDYPVEVMEDRDFEDYVARLKKEDEGKNIVEGILMERGDLNYRMTETDNTMTEAVISEAGEKWSHVTDEYLLQYLSILRDTGMF